MGKFRGEGGSCREWLSIELNGNTTSIVLKQGIGGILVERGA